MNKIIKAIVCVAALMPAVLSAAPELRGTPDELSVYLADAPGQVTVIGEGEIIVPANEMKLTFAVKTRHASLNQAIVLNQRIRTEIIDYLVGKGLAREKITSEKFSSTPKYGLFGDHPKSYEVINNLKVSVANEGQFIAASTVVDKWEEAYYQGADAEQSDEDLHKREAIRKALEDAGAKKAVYEKALGTSLRAHRVHNAQTTFTQPVRQAAYRGKASAYREDSLGSMSSFIVSEPDLDGQSGENSVSFGNFTYNATVQIDYLMNGK